MKFQPDSLPGANVVSRHEPGRVWIGPRMFDRSVLVPWTGAVLDWAPTAFEGLAAADFERILLLEPELVIFGSGAGLRFVRPALARALIDARVGIETMDTAAACRTFNVLVNERRAVVAALLIETAAGSHPPAG